MIRAGALLLLAALGAAPLPATPPVVVAAASNLAPVLEPLEAAFRAWRPAGGSTTAIARTTRMYRARLWA